MQSVRPGQIINQRYVVGRLLGRGGMSDVYLAEQQPLGRTVALKVMRAPGDPNEEEQFKKRFFREASLCARLAHPTIVTIHDFGPVEGAPGAVFFLAMEYVNGQTLGHRLQVSGSLDPNRVVALAIEITRGLREAHRAGVVHRDIKPDNVMLCPGDDGQDAVKLLDFGLVREVQSYATSEGVTGVGSYIGTLAYMAPEQINGSPLDGRADLYALGGLLFECLTGKRPFDETSAGTLIRRKLAGVPPELPPEVRQRTSTELQGLLRALLRVDPANRPADSEALLRQLRALPEAGRASSPEAAPRIASVRTAARYDLGKPLARGPRVAVHEATQQPLGRPVVIKLFAPTPHGEQLASALAYLARLKHPCNERILDAGVARSSGQMLPFAVLEPMEGVTLRELLERQGSLPPLRAAAIVSSVLQGLSEAHGLGITHTAVAPDHVLVGPAARGEPVRLFGYASSRQLAAPVPRAPDGDAPRTPLSDASSLRLDLEGAGRLLLACLAGSSAAGAERGVDPALGEIARRALDPARCYRSASAMLQALRAASTPADPQLDVSTPSTRDFSRGLWGERPVSIWVLSDDPGFKLPTVREALGVLGARYELHSLDPEQRANAITMLRDEKLIPPWVVLFGDVSVLLEEPLLGALRSCAETSRLLVATHRNPELLRQGINLSSPHQHIALPSSVGELVGGVELMVERSRAIRKHYDRIRSALSSSTLLLPAEASHRDAPRR